jgi:hypothetical protein
MRSAIIAAMLLPATAGADTCRALIAGTGCRTRQQAIQRIFEKLSDVEDVTILPRRDAPADNHRYFVIESKGKPPTKEALIAALGRRAEYYKVLTVDPIPEKGG